MSSTNRGGKRSAADYYPTPPWPVRRLLERLPLRRGRWLESSAGEGHIIRAVEPIVSGIEWTAVELRPECGPLLTAAGERVRSLTGNFLSADRDWLGLAEGEFFDVAIGNPPFCHALDFVEHTRRFASTTVLLLRLGFLETEERAAWLSKWMPDVFVIPDRISFTGDGSDSTGYAWFAWFHSLRTSVSNLRVLSTTPLEERKERAVLELPIPVIPEQQELLLLGGES